MNVRGVVLTGGSSTRMGRDKAFVEVRGRAMAALVADALTAGGCDEVVCQGGDLARLAAVGLAAVPDRIVGAGPAAALVQAIENTEWSVADAVVIAACDLPDLTGEVVAALLAAVERDPGRVAVATTGDRHHLLVAVRRESAAAVVGAGPVDATDDRPDRRSVRALLARLDLVAVEVAPAAVRNMNRPADLRRSVAPRGR